MPVERQFEQENAPGFHAAARRGDSIVILLTGASGFIGSHLARALAGGGHRVIRTSRGVAATATGDVVHADFMRDLDAATWLPRLEGVDVVVNAVGILRESARQTFERLHDKTPRALFAACAQAGVKLVVQISALGADATARSRYHRSKKEADDALLRLGLRGFIVQPSLVYGPGGASARLFDTLASLPVVPLPGDGNQRIQPIHIDDLVAAIVRMVEAGDAAPAPAERVPLVGAQPSTLREFLAALRCAMGLPRARWLRVPLPMMRAGAAAGSIVPGALLDAETLAMLQRGNTASSAPVERWLGRAPREAAAFVPRDHARAARLQARLGWLLPMLRWSIAIVWIVTGIVSLGLYPVRESYALLARAGVPDAIAPVMLYGAAALDLALGIATVVARRRRALWLLQMTVIIGYTAIITWKLPEFWLHPYGPVLKNLPLLAGLWMLHALEDPP